MSHQNLTYDNYRIYKKRKTYRNLASNFLRLVKSCKYCRLNNDSYYNSIKVILDSNLISNKNIISDFGRKCSFRNTLNNIVNDLFDRDIRIVNRSDLVIKILKLFKQYGFNFVNVDKHKFINHNIDNTFFYTVSSENKLELIDSLGYVNNRIYANYTINRNDDLSSFQNYPQIYLAGNKYQSNNLSDLYKFKVISNGGRCKIRAHSATIRSSNSLKFLKLKYNFTDIHTLTDIIPKNENSLTDSSNVDDYYLNKNLIKFMSETIKNKMILDDGRSFKFDDFLKLIRFYRFKNNYQNIEMAVTDIWRLTELFLIHNSFKSLNEFVNINEYIYSNSSENYDVPNYYITVTKNYSQFHTPVILVLLYLIIYHIDEILLYKFLRNSITINNSESGDLKTVEITVVPLIPELILYFESYKLNIYQKFNSKLSNDHHNFMVDIVDECLNILNNKLESLKDSNSKLVYNADCKFIKTNFC